MTLRELAEQPSLKHKVHVCRGASLGVSLGRQHGQCMHYTHMVSDRHHRVSSMHNSSAFCSCNHHGNILPP